jgi:hypothetical protein
VELNTACGGDKDGNPFLWSRERHKKKLVNAPWTEKRGVDKLRTIRRGDNIDLAACVKSVEFCEKLIDDAICDAI